MPSPQEIQEYVGGKFFRVSFIKRTNGKLRVMRARTGVKKHLSGKGAPYSFNSKGLLSVWDVDAKGYRSVPTDAIVDFQCGDLRWDSKNQKIVRLES